MPVRSRQGLWIPQATGEGSRQISPPCTAQEKQTTTTTDNSTAAAFTTKERMEDRNPGTPDTGGSCWKSPIPLGFQKSIWHFSTAQ